MVTTKLPAGFAKVKHQFLAILCANIITLSHGCILGWLSPFLPLLKSPESPLASGAVTLEEASWIGAIICVGGVLGNFMFGTLVSYLGCKRAISCLAFPQVGFWLSVMFGTNVYHLYIARIFAGMTGGGVFVCIPLFVAEIADDHIRGTLGSLLLVNCNIGILISFVVGAYVRYATVPYLMIAMPMVFLCAFSFLPDTPQHLLSCDKVADAERAMRFYRNCSATDAAKAQAACPQFAADFERMRSAAQQKRGDEKGGFQWADLCTPAARRGLLIGITLCAINQFSGCFALINYSATIFHDSGSHIDAHLASIILASVQICGTYVSTCLVDRLGRKVLLITSCVGTAAGLTVMGAYTYAGEQLRWPIHEYSWVPVASLSWVIFVASIGILPLPFVVLAEVLPARIRAVGSTMCVTSVSVVSFVVLKSFPLVSAAIGLYGCMWIFAGICVFGVVFIAVCVEETRGKSLEAVARARGMSLY